MTDNSPARLKARRSDAIYEALAEAIRGGFYEVGSKLPSEAALAAEHEVSRPTLREALARLREEGLIQSRQGSGIYVQTAPRQIRHIAPLASINDLRHCFEYRIGLESEAARLAATRRSAANLQQLRTLFEAMEQRNEAGENGMDEDFAFHLCVAEASGNRFIVAGLEQVRTHIAQGMEINRTLSLESTGDRLRKVQSEHARLIQALTDQDAQASAEAMEAHLRNAMNRFLGGS